MRTVDEAAAVRLYRLDGEGTAATLYYGSLADALRVAAGEPEQGELFVQTRDDVVAYLDLVEG